MKSSYGSRRDGFLATRRLCKVAGSGNCGSGGSMGGGGDSIGGNG